MKDDLDPLDPELSRLFGAERRNVSVDPAAKARVLARVTSAAPLVPVRPALRPGPLAAAFVAGGLVGAAAVALLGAPRVVYIDRIVPAASASTTPEPPTSGPAFVVPSASPSAAPHAVAAAAAPSSDALARERALLDVAHTALGRHEGQRALDAASQHLREFRHGQMTEEREAIAVQALVLLDRRDEALDRGARFKKRWPGSVFVPVIDAALIE